MDPIEELKIQVKDTSKGDIQSVIDLMDKPHYPQLIFNRIKVEDLMQVECNIYSSELQQSLSKYDNEREKIGILTPVISYNKYDNLEYVGGDILIGLNFLNYIDGMFDVNGFRVGYYKNMTADINSKIFRSLKSKSVYSKYLLDKLTGNDIYSIYSKEIFDKLDNRLNSIDTYTIVYRLSDTSLREVTKHDFGKFGNIVMTSDFKMK